MKYYYLLILLLHQWVDAQTINNAYNIKWVGEEQGLTNLNASNAILDDRGFLWIATDLGLYEYDGLKARPVKSNAYPQLNSQRIVNLFQDTITNDIYFNTFPEEKCYQIKEGIVRQLGLKDGIMFKHLFLSCSNAFFKAFIAYNKNENPNSNSLIYHYYTSVTQDVLYIKDKAKIVLLKKDGTYSTIATTSKSGYILFNIQNKVFDVGYKKISIINSEKDTKDLKIDAVLQKLIESEDYYDIYSSLIKSNETYFLNIDSKVYKINYENNTLSTTFLFELKDSKIFKLSYNPKENIYFIGTVNSGLAILYKNNFNTIVVPDKNVEYSVVSKGRKLYSFNGWIYNHITEKVSDRTVKNNTSNFRFLLKYTNDYYYQMPNNKLISITNLKTTLECNANKLPYLTGFTHLNNTLWLSNSKSVGQLIHNQIKIDSTVVKKLSVNQEINAIDVKENKLLFATTKGVFLYSPFTHDFEYIKGLEKVNARYIKHIDKNSFWVGCYGEGLFLVYKNKTFKVQDATILIKAVHAVEEDKFGNLWISTNNGLLTVNKQKALKNIRTNVPIESYLYTMMNGLPTDEFNGGSTFPSINNKGIIGFPSMKGFIWFMPEKLKKHVFSGDIKIDKIAVDNKFIGQQKRDYFKIPAKAEVVNLFLKYGYYYNRKNISVFFKLDSEQNWSKMELNNLQIARKKPGLATLQIKIHTHGTDTKFDVIKSFKIDFEKRYYELFWFRIFLSFLLTLVILIAYSVGVIISNRKKINLETKIEEKTLTLKNALLELEDSKKSLTQTLLEKDLLLKEVHHRVKNNLQLTISMLKIQARRKNYSSIFDFLNKGESRINAMALIHRRLYKMDEALNKIDLQAYLKDLTDSINLTHIENEMPVKIDIECHDIMLNLSTSIPVGLILNELITNSLKHAFQNRTDGLIEIKIVKLDANYYSLTVEDNGVGFDAATNYTNSFGLELIQLLVQQLRGTCTVDSYHKTKYSILFYEIDLQTGINKDF